MEFDLVEADFTGKMAVNMDLDAPQKYQEGEDFELWLDSFVGAMELLVQNKREHCFFTYWGKKLSKK